MTHENETELTMVETLRKPFLYDDDFYGWATEQAALLRQGRLDQADIPHLIEEIETLGRSERRELESAYRLICMHLLKMIHQPQSASRSWLNTVVRERNNVESILDASPSLKAQRPELFAKAYRQARKEAAVETGLRLAIFPDEPPFTLEQAEQDSFLPPALVEHAPGSALGPREL
jgi:hypothetical protein